eukprot:COSAG04_NODE_18445_length_441_cov_1.055556_2_plen_96_part_01
MDGELRVGSAAHLCERALVRWEAGPKCSRDVRAEFEQGVMRTAKPFYSAMAKAHTDDSVAKVIARVVELQMLEQDGVEDMSVGCGAAFLLTMFSIV